MSEPDGRSRVSRSDLRVALAWCTQSSTRAALVVLFLALAGVASALGFLRWHHPYARWSFAVLCWIAAAVVVAAARGRNRQPTDAAR